MAKTALFENADVTAVKCACAHTLYYVFIYAFLGRWRRFRVWKPGNHFIRFLGRKRYGISVDGKHSVTLLAKFFLILSLLFPGLFMTLKTAMKRLDKQDEIRKKNYANRVIFIPFQIYLD